MSWTEDDAYANGPVSPWYVVGLVLLAAALWLMAGGAHAQTTTTFTDRLVLADPPAKSSETACLWRDASTGMVAAGACPTGTVTSVGLTMPGIFSVSGSPVTGAGTLTASLANQAANLIFAGPASGGAAAPTFRALGDADVPDNLTLGAVGGNPSFTGNATIGGTLGVTGATTLAATSISGGSNNPLTIYDTRAAAAGVGGGLNFFGNYTGTSSTVAAHIYAAKSNATAGNWGFDLVFRTREHNSADVAERMRIASTGAVTIGGHVDTAQAFRATGYGGPSSGTGIEVGYYPPGPYGYVQAITRPAGTHQPLLIDGSSITLGASGRNTTIGGNATISGTLGVTSDIGSARAISALTGRFNGAVVPSGAFTSGIGVEIIAMAGAGYISANAAPGSGTWIPLHLRAATVAMSGNATIGGTLGVTGATTLSSTLNTTGISTFGNTVRGNGWQSGLTNWGVTLAGAADFRSITADELRVKVFIADLERALAGGQVVAKSAAIVAADMVLPANGAGATLRVFDLPGAPNLPVFDANDWVLLRVMSRDSGGLTVINAWGLVTGYADQTDGTQTWTWTRQNLGTGGSGTVKADSLALDYGQSGDGFVWSSAAGAFAPFVSVNTWATDPTQITTRARMGRLDGITGATDEFGGLFGDYAGRQYFRASNANVSLHGVNLSLYDGTTEVIKLDRTAPSLALGNALPTYAAGTGVWMGKDGAAYKFRVGAAGGQGITWDGNNLSVRGSITVEGTIPSTSVSGLGALATKNSVDLATGEVTNKSLANVDSAASTKLAGIEAGATVGAAWGTNLTGRPVELTDGRVATALNAAGTVVTKVVPASVAAPSSAGLYLGSDYLGYYNGSLWRTYMDNAGRFYLSGTGSHALAWDGANLSITGSITLTNTIPAASVSGLAATATSSDFSVITGATKPENNATVGANWNTNLTNIPSTLGTPSGTGLFLSSTHLGYYTGGNWTSYIKSDGTFKFYGASDKYIEWTGSALNIRGSLNATDITAGTLSADRIAAGSITASKLNVTATGENFTADGSFEYGRTAWVCYDNSGTQTTHCGRWTETTENAVRYGKTMWIVNWNSSSETKGVYGPLMPRGWMPNKPYTIAFWARHNGLTNATAMRLGWNVTPTYSVGVSNPNLSGTWQRYVFHITWGASVEGGGYGYITIDQTVQSGAGGLWIDGLQVFAGHLDPELIGYTEAAQDVPDGTIVANMIAATAINGKTITGATFQTGSLDGTWDGKIKINGTDGIRIAGQAGYGDYSRAISWFDDSWGYVTAYWDNTLDTFFLDGQGTIRIGGRPGSSSPILTWGGSTASPPTPFAYLYFSPTPDGLEGISFRTYPTTYGVDAWDSFKPGTDGRERLGTSTKRWSNIHLNLPSGASTSLTYVLVNDPTDVSRLYAFTGGLDGTTTCGAGQSIYSITVEKGLVTAVACR